MPARRGRSAVAIDVDPAAVEATSANAGRNGVGDRVEASTADLSEVAGSFDVVVANIGVRVLARPGTGAGGGRSGRAARSW